MRITSITFVLASLLLFAACEYGDVDEVKFKTKESKWVLPLLKADFELKDVLDQDPEEVEFVTDAGSGKELVQLVYRENDLASFGLDELYQIPDMEPADTTFKIGERTIDDLQVEPLQLTLGEIASASGNTKLDFLLDRSMVLTTETTIGLGQDYSFATLDNIQWVVIDAGRATLTVTNNLSVPIRIDLELVNAAAKNTVAGALVPSATGWIAPNTSEVVDLSSQLSNKKVENKLLARLNSIVIGTSGGKAVTLSRGDSFTIAPSLKNISLVEGAAQIPEQSINTRTFTTQYGEGDAKLKELMVKTLKADFTLESDLELETEVTFTFPFTKQAGQPVTKTFVVDFSKNKVQQLSLVLDNSVTDLSGGKADAYNVFTAQVDLRLKSSGQRYVEFAADDEIKLRGQFSNIDIAYVKGYLGQHEFNLDEDTFDFDDELSETLTGQLKLLDPKFNFFIQNKGIGVPAALTFSLARDGNTGFSREITFSPATAMGQVFEQELVIENAANNDLSEFLTLPAKNISYSGSGKINADATTDYNQFIEGDATLSIGAKVELPLYFELSNLVYTDTFDIDMYSEEDAEDIVLAEIKAFITNGFPLELNAKFVFLDKDKKPLNLNTFVENTYQIPAAKTEQGIVLDGQEGIANLLIGLSREEINLLPAAEHIVVIASMNGGNEGQAKIFTDYKVMLNLGAKVDISTDLE